jgi:hypothetical protein
MAASLGESSSPQLQPESQTSATMADDSAKVRSFIDLPSPEKTTPHRIDRPIG